MTAHGTIGRPGGLFHNTEGAEVKICLASTLSSIRAICLNRVRCRAWIISVSRDWLIWHRSDDEVQLLDKTNAVY